LGNGGAEQDIANQFGLCEQAERLGLEMSKKSKSFKRARSSITGQFVSMEYALAHPETTVIETVKIKKIDGN
jgi:hypothetical protein